MSLSFLRDKAKRDVLKNTKAMFAQGFFYTQNNVAGGQI